MKIRLVTVREKSPVNILFRDKTLSPRQPLVLNLRKSLNVLLFVLLVFASSKFTFTFASSHDIFSSDHEISARSGIETISSQMELPLAQKQLPTLLFHIQNARKAERGHCGSSYKNKRRSSDADEEGLARTTISRIYHCSATVYKAFLSFVKATHCFMILER